MSSALSMIQNRFLTLAAQCDDPQSTFSVDGEGLLTRSVVVPSTSWQRVFSAISGQWTSEQLRLVEVFSTMVQQLHAEECDPETIQNVIKVGTALNSQCADHGWNQAYSKICSIVSRIISFSKITTHQPLAWVVDPSSISRINEMKQRLFVMSTISEWHEFKSYGLLMRTGHVTDGLQFAVSEDGGLCVVEKQTVELESTFKARYKKSPEIIENEEMQLVDALIKMAKQYCNENPDKEGLLFVRDIALALGNQIRMHRLQYDIYTYKYAKALDKLDILQSIDKYIDEWPADLSLSWLIDPPILTPTGFPSVSCVVPPSELIKSDTPAKILREILRTADTQYIEAPYHVYNQIKQAKGV